MATNVIHGIGKPRFVLPTSIILSGKTVGNATEISLRLLEETDLTALNNQWGLIGFIVFSYNSSNEFTWGVIKSFDDSKDEFVITSDGWSNGVPETGKSVYLQGRAIDLPYCQRLTESFQPDYIIKKMLTGRLKFKKLGFYYRASLNYAKYLHKNEMLQIIKLFNTQINQFGFYPRRDNKALFYSVEIDPESELSFYQLSHHQGHGGLVLNIIGIDRLSKISGIDPVVTFVGSVPAASDYTYPLGGDEKYPML